MEFLHYVEVSVTIAGLNIIADGPVEKDFLDFIKTADLDLHADVKVMALFTENTRVLDDMICDFDGFEDNLRDEFAEEVFSNPSGGHEKEEGKTLPQEAGQNPKHNARVGLIALIIGRQRRS